MTCTDIIHFIGLLRNSFISPRISIFPETGSRKASRFDAGEKLFPKEPIITIKSYRKSSNFRF